jgi:hypothetical protein
MAKAGVVLAILGWSAPAFAEGAMAGKFAFSTTAKPEQTRCAKIGASLAAKLKPPKFKCEASRTGAGAAVTVCLGVGDGAPGYMVFATMKACESERKDESVAE